MTMETYDTRLFSLLLSSLRICFESNSRLIVLIAAIVRSETAFATFLAACSTSPYINWRHIFVCWRNYAIESAQFSVDYIAFDAPNENKQNGPFYSTKIPIHIIKIGIEPGANLDPFAIRKWRQILEKVLHYWFLQGIHIMMYLVRNSFRSPQDRH